MLPLPPQQWAERTFECAELGDKRRTKRLTRVAIELAAHTGSSLASSCEGDLAVVEGAYRLIGNEAGKRSARKQRPYEEKESFKWQQSSENIKHRLGAQMTKVVSVCDREADVYEYIQYKLTHDQRFVVRATQNRILIDHDQLLFDALSEEPALGTYTIKVPQRGGQSARKARKATLEVKKKTVTIQSPQRPGGRLAPITVNILIAEEINNDTEDRLRWILLTSESVETLEDCRTVLRFYALRWRIEELHKACIFTAKKPLTFP
ncbi:IS4 family transposase [Endozoicomonas sp. 4G]|uniref:IS4 family transposase n=1 Tax=Endozoicomonas sp. 4G TaxID=2872754 RepID=UPI0020787B0C|nr:IS4 family transposase [Endozoicomonas sp. 4G]